MNTFAFPSNGTMGEVVEQGMTLRDYFAAKAMQSLIITATGQGVDKKQALSAYPLIPAAAYQIADAMLKERAND